MLEKKKALVIGAQGLIGQMFIQKSPESLVLQGTYHKRPYQDAVQCDITQPDQVKNIFTTVRPDYVFHCANVGGGVPFCENNPGLSKKFHFDGTVNIGKLCQEFGAKYIFISTECVFDGKKKDVYTEEDSTSPLSIYGRYKVESEEWIQKNLNKYIILRTMSVFGWQPETQTPNALMSMYFAISQGKTIPVATYRWCNPTLVNSLAQAMLELGLSDKNGIYHYTGSDYLNRYEWLKECSDHLGWNSDLLIPDDNAPEKALYPLEIRLSTQKFKNECRTRIIDLDVALAVLRNKIHQKN